MSFAIIDPPLPPFPKRRRMRPAAGAAREITYAHSAATPLGRAMIRSVENATGRASLLRRAEGYGDEVAAGRDFWRVMMERFGLRLDILRGSLDTMPAIGPLVVVSNHPFGILDGLVMGHILSAVRGGDFRIVAHQVFDKAPDVNRAILPIDFSGSRDAQARNIATRAEAIRYLKAGGAVGIFPGGTVATGATPLAPARDPLWRNFTAKMVTQSGATIVPLWFEGQNSRLFQLSSHLHYSLRMALLVREFAARTDRPVRLAVGGPIPHQEVASAAQTPKEVMDFLRRKTYDLSSNPSDWARLGHEFEDTYRR
ncbi:lysophospholipid acyltransferase family protein [Rhodobacter sp. NTK016B]|uniref:lysophospholipid acyltransferase family protein n=1 Tax=Rhodobacter sp. NTK016B TaxID=2759676 RepID=UPI0025704F19|nr:lysophospholipid acyltransferase family protein [Rhodobacter sp. NTK016B]